MTWDGDIAQMGALADRIADLATVPSRAAARVSRYIYGLIQDEFDAGVDPYDAPWKPLSTATIAKGRKTPPLTDTRDMRDSLDVRPLAGAGVSVTIDHPAAPHQTGWNGPISSGPARPILPSGSALPESWDDAISAACLREFRT